MFGISARFVLYIAGGILLANINSIVKYYVEHGGMVYHRDLFFGPIDSSVVQYIFCTTNTILKRHR